MPRLGNRILFMPGRQFLALNNVLQICLNIVRKIMSIETNEYINQIVEEVDL